jgi:hypothetical protein
VKINYLQNIFIETEVKITTPRHIMFHILKIGTSTSPYIKKEKKREKQVTRQ